MEITIQTKENVTIIVLNGNLLGESHTESILDVVNDAIQKGNVNFVFEVQDMKYINSIGLTIFINTLTKARKNNGDLCLVNVPSQLANLLKITKLEQIIQTCTSVDNAVKKFNSKSK